jgi:hypothetical protein
LHPQIWQAVKVTDTDEDEEDESVEQKCLNTGVKVMKHLKKVWAIVDENCDPSEWLSRSNGQPPSAFPKGTLKPLLGPRTFPLTWGCSFHTLLAWVRPGRSLGKLKTGGRREQLSVHHNREQYRHHTAAKSVWNSRAFLATDSRVKTLPLGACERGIDLKLVLNEILFSHLVFVQSKK